MTAGGRIRQPIAAISLYQLSDDPHPALARLRAETPVAWFEETGMWLVTRRDDVMAVLRDPERFTTDHPRSPIGDIFGRQMLALDGDQQKRAKAACIQPFSRRAVAEQWQGVVAAKVDRLILAVEWRGRADLRQALCGPLAVASVGSVLGIPDEFHPVILEWYERFARALANFTADPDARLRGQLAAAEFRLAMRPLLLRAAAEPTAGLFSTLVHAADRLSDDEILSNALIILFGGIETTDATIANTVWALLTHPGALAWARTAPGGWGAAVEESLRWEPAVQSCTRYATRDVTLGGVVIGAGDPVQCMLGAANRDPAAFSDPDRFDAERPNADEHLSFGLGRHLCLGAHLAREETTAVLAALFGRLTDLRLDPEHPARPAGYEFRKPAELRVRWRVAERGGNIS